MIAEDISKFPGNVIIKLQSALRTIDPEVPVYMRPALETDGVQSISVYPTEMHDIEESTEIRGAVLGAQVPVLNDYLVSIVGVVMHSDQQLGISQMSTMSSLIRSTVASDPTLDVALKTLATIQSGRTERARRWRIRRTVFQSGDLRGMFLYVSRHEFWLQTETS